MHNFGPAMEGESTVYGASRPGYGRQQIDQDNVAAWLDFMAVRGMQRICCLLSTEQLRFYDGLLDQYRRYFGDERVCWAPVPDFHLVELSTLRLRILPFLTDADRRGEPVVVHCSAGSGRTGHVLAAWLVIRHGMTTQQAIDAVITTGRNPYEAEGRSATGQSRLHDLLAACHL